MNKAELEAVNTTLEQENAELKKEIEALEAKLNSPFPGVSHPVDEDGVPVPMSPAGGSFLEPLLLGACIGALRNPITGVAYDEAEFNAYAPAFIDQAVRLHNMALSRLDEMAQQEIAKAAG